MIAQLRTLAGSMMGSLVIIGVVLLFVLEVPGLDLEAPPAWVPGAQLAAAAVVHLVAESIGYRTPAIPPGMDQAKARTLAATVFTTGTILRSALCESIALGSLVVAFVLESGGFACYLTGAAVSLALMAVHAWPGRRPIGRTMTSLERDGGRSYLRDQLGLSPAGPIQEL